MQTKLKLKITAYHCYNFGLSIWSTCYKIKCLGEFGFLIKYNLKKMLVQKSFMLKINTIIQQKSYDFLEFLDIFPFRRCPDFSLDRDPDFWP